MNNDWRQLSRDCFSAARLLKTADGHHRSGINRAYYGILSEIEEKIDDDLGLNVLLVLAAPED
ncbi:MAG: hypothetical protein KAS72_06450 [Phycisphaerales bacterium]|nr:hypothetical protein [Phycisphaerales bacterium]